MASVVDLLKGQRILDVRLAREDETDLDRTVVLELSNGCSVLVMSDDEGNQPGTLHVLRPDGRVAYANGWMLAKPKTARGGVAAAAK